MQLNPLRANESVVDATGKPLQVLRLFSEGVSTLPPFIGTGSPEGVVEARQTRFYMDDAGVAGAILYMKQLDDIAGDKTMGWVLV